MSSLAVGGSTCNDQEPEHKITSLSLSFDNNLAWPIMFPYSVIAAIDSMTKIEARVFLYCCRLINGFEGREGKVVSILKIAQAIGASRKQVGRVLDNLSRATNDDGSLRQTFLKKIYRGKKKAYEIRVVFPGCTPIDMKEISPESIDGRMFCVPSVFFDGHENTQTLTPLREWSLIDIQIFFRICAIHSQKEYNPISIASLVRDPLQLTTVILPHIQQRWQRVLPSLQLFQSIGLVSIHVDRGDDTFKVIQPCVDDYSKIEHPSPEIPHDASKMSHDSPGMSHDSPKMSHDSRPTHLNKMSHDSPEMSHDSPEMSHDSPEMSHDSPGMSHDSPKMSHDSRPTHLNKMSHDSPKMSYVPPEMSHDSPGMSHDSPKMSHFDSVVVVSLKNTTTEPARVSELFTLKIAETDDEIPCSITEAINFAIENTTQKIEDKGRYAGGLRRRAKNGIVIQGDGNDYLDIASYVRSKINGLIDQQSGEIRQQIKSIIKSGYHPLVTPKKGRTCVVKKITDDLLMIEANSGNASKTLYGNDASLYLTSLEKVEQGKAILPPSTIEIIKAAIDEGKQVDLFSKSSPLINIVDHVGAILISVSEGEKSELNEDDIVTLQKPAILKGPGYKLRINGRFVDD